MNDLVRRRVIDTKHVKVFVLDEADQMLDQGGLGDQTTRLKKYVAVFETRLESLMRVTAL